MKVEIMDTTLRDGEQTSGVAFTDTEKLSVAKMLLKEVCVDRIEAASARISEGELSGVKLIVDWAKKENMLDKIEVLGFVDKDKSVEWISKSGCRVMNLLCKGSLKHVTGQLGKTPAEHIEDIKETISLAIQKGIKINIYLEDWSNGVKDSPDYVFQIIEALKSEKIMRFMLPDTLGILNPSDTFKFCKIMTERFSDIHFDFHGHNDYDLVEANTLESVKAGCRGVHTTINGLGERAGNACLSSVAAVLKDHLNAQISIKEEALYKISKLLEVFSGIRVPSNKPVIGENVFTQTCGVHADGDKKGNLYFNALLPERFGRVRKYALGKTSGKASILKNLEELGLELTSQAMNEVTKKVVELGDKKENITTEDLPYIISDVLGSEVIKEKIKINNYFICHSHSLRPVATVSLVIDEKTYEETSTGDGQYDAFAKSIFKIYNRLGRKIPSLIDYVVTIPPGGKTDALVETSIYWQKEDGTEFKTRGLDSDQTAAAIKATMKMLNIIENG